MDKDYRSLEHKIRDVVAEASMNRNTDLRRKVVNVGRPDTAPSNFDDKSKLAKQGEIKTKIIDEDKNHGLFKYNKRSGLWDHQRSVTPETKDQWLHQFKKDEPDEHFVVSKNKPKHNPLKENAIAEAKDKEDDEDKDDKNKKVDADADDKDDKKKSKSGDAKKPEDQMSGGKTEVDLEPKTDDKVVVDSDDKPKKTKKVTKEETMMRSDNKFGLPQDLIDAVTEALKGGQKKLDKNNNGKLDGHDFKILRGETKAKAKPEHDKARTAFTAKEEVEEIDEVSKEYLKTAARKAEADYRDREKKGGDLYKDKMMKKRNDQSWRFRIAASQKEEVEEIDEAVKTGNEGHGYHGEAHHAAKGEDKMAEAGKAYAKAHSLVKKHAADHLKNAKNPNVMVKHYLDSKHGRHLYGNENNAAYVKKDFGHFAKKYDAKMHEEVEELDELSKQTLASYVNKAGDSRTVQGYTMAKSNSTAIKKRALNRDVNRMTGIRRATNRLAKEEVELSADEIARLEEISKGL